MHGKSMWLTATVKTVAHSSGKFAQLLRFAIVGVLATGIQYVIYLLLIGKIDIPPSIAAIISYAISFVCNFILSNIFTFKTQPTAGRAVSFAISHVINFVMQAILVSFFSRLVGDEMALLPAIAVCFPVNFVIVRYALTALVGNEQR